MKKKVIYVTTVGDTPLAVTNSFWCSVRDDKLPVYKVFLLCSRDDERRGIKGTFKHFKELRESLLRIAERLGLPLSKEDVSCIIVEEENPISVYNSIKEIYLKWSNGYELCVDITGGRKTMSSGALLFARDYEARCYYFWLFDPRRNRDKSLDQMTENRDYELVRVHEIWKGKNLL